MFFVVVWNLSIELISWLFLSLALFPHFFMAFFSLLLFILVVGWFEVWILNFVFQQFRWFFSRDFCRKYDRIESQIHICIHLTAIKWCRFVLIHPHQFKQICNALISTTLTRSPFRCFLLIVSYSHRARFTAANIVQRVVFLVLWLFVYVEECVASNHKSEAKVQSTCHCRIVEWLFLK